MNYKIKFLFLIIFVSAQTLFGQIIPRDSSNFAQSYFQNNKLNNSFNKQLNTYSLNSELIYSLKKDNFFWGIKETFSSTVNKSSTKNIKDEQSLYLVSDYRINRFFAPGILLKHSIYSDNRKIDINQASYFNSIIYSKLIPANRIQIVPYLGYSYNKQSKENDKGLLLGIEGAVNRIQLTDMNISMNVKYENENINPRQNELHYANLSLENAFEDGLMNNFSVYYSSLRRDFYFEADSVTTNNYNVTNNIQTRTENNYYIQERIYYYVPNSNFGFDFSGKITWRDIDKTTRYIYVQNGSPSTLDAKINEFKMEFYSAFEYRTDNYFSNLRINYSEQEEKHLPKRIDNVSNIFFNSREELEKQLNNKAKQITISISNNFLLTDKDQLSLSLFHHKLIYDTPSSENFDDRDELLSMIQIYYQRKLSPFFNLFVNLEGNFNKIVYIFAERSANNNTKRVIKLSSGGYYVGKNFVSTNSAEVSANYIVYDFEDINPTYKSYSFRQFIYRDSTGIKLDKKIELVFAGYLKLSEQGDFNWDDFAGTPQRYLQEIYIEPKMYYIFKNIKFGVGLRYFELSTYLYTSGTNKTLDTRYRSIAPLSEITYNLLSKLSLKVNCWYEFIRNENNTLRNQTYMNFDLRWKF